jgi:hypothetical protein
LSGTTGQTLISKTGCYTVKVLIGSFCGASHSITLFTTNEPVVDLTTEYADYQTPLDMTGEAAIYM